ISPLAAVYGASLGRAVLGGMAVTVIGFPSWRCGRACCQPHRKEQPPPLLIHRSCGDTSQLRETRPVWSKKNSKSGHLATYGASPASVCLQPVTSLACH